MKCACPYPDVGGDIPSYFLRPDYYVTTVYHFFFEALKRNPDLEPTYFPYEETFDWRTVKDYDLVFGFYAPYHIDQAVSTVPDWHIPILTRPGDPHYADAKGYKLKHRVLSFNSFPPTWFHRYYPAEYPYRMILHGIEPRLYEGLPAWNERIQDKILNSGVIAPTHYVLREQCNQLRYVYYEYAGLDGRYIGDNYPKLLGQYRAAIAATTTTPTMKYNEIPASGCLTFMEVTEQNQAATWGFRDMETAIFITPENYRERFGEYLGDPDNSKWQRIADAGRKYVLETMNNDVAVRKLVEWVKE